MFDPEMVYTGTSDGLDSFIVTNAAAFSQRANREDCFDADREKKIGKARFGRYHCTDL